VTLPLCLRRFEFESNDSAVPPCETVLYNFNGNVNRAQLKVAATLRTGTAGPHSAGRVALRGMPQIAQPRCNSIMKTSFEETATTIWRQVLVENEPVVALGGERYPVTQSRAKKLRRVVFEFDGESFIGIEQNPKTKSRWAAMACAGKKVMQFIQDGRYIAVVADGKVMLYGKRKA
jgi:hypothetical protein